MMAAPISTWRRLRTTTPTSSGSTGKGSCQSSSARNCEAPAKTKAENSPTSSRVSPVCVAKKP